MKHIVVGLGEVGSAILNLLNDSGRRDAAEGQDALKGIWATPEPHAVMHVAIPYSEQFVTAVQVHQENFRPATTIIHSTVPIGTTAQIPGAVHSPVLGRAATMLSDLKRFTKWIGGPDVDAAVAHLTDYGLKCSVVHSSEVTEALKLLDLAYYGVDIAFSHIAKDVLGKVGADFEEWHRYMADYNASVGRAHKGRILWPDGDRIGGHCVIPGVEMLNATLGRDLLKAVLRHA